MRYLRLSIFVFLLALFSAPALGTVNYDSYWYWMWGPEAWLHDSPTYGCEYLTSNNGARAVSMTTYGSSPVKVWVNVVASNQYHGLYDNVSAVAHQFDDFLPDADGLQYKDTTTIQSDEDLDYWNVCVSAADGSPDGRKVAVFSEIDETNNNYAHASADDLQRMYRPWPNSEQLSPGGIWDGEATSAVVMEDRNNGCAVFPAGYDGDPSDYEGLMATWTTDGGDSWDPDSIEYIVTPLEAGPYLYNPSICTGTNGVLHVAYAATPTGGAADTIKYSKGSDHGSSWGTPVQLSWPGSQPCIACSPDGNIVVICWNETALGHSYICYTYSTNGGNNWVGAVYTVPLDYNAATTYSHPSISIELTGGKPTVIMTCAVENASRSSVTAA
jgi:hypothetical protein